MKIELSVPVVPALLLLGACTTSMQTATGPGATLTPEQLPEGVIALAAPNQNLQTVRVQPEDGCYWYQHTGPVETTYVPLRSRDGRPICTRPQNT